MLNRGRSQLHIVTGKGGVGKTTVSTVMALAYAKQGKKVLLAEANGGDQISRLLEVEPVGAVMREVEENLWIVDMRPDEAMHEYILMTLRFEALYKAVFRNRFVRRFLRLIPSLGELVMLGKLWYHVKEKNPDGSRKFDVVILDAPATGHAITLLRVPAVVEEAVPPGPMREISQRVREMLYEQSLTSLDIVTTPEEMPLTETLTLIDAAKERLNMRVGQIFVNHTISKLGDDAMQLIQGDALSEDLSRALLQREARRMVGEEQLQQLPDDLLKSAIFFPRLVGESFGKKELQTLADILSSHRSSREGEMS